MFVFAVIFIALIAIVIINLINAALCIFRKSPFRGNDAGQFLYDDEGHRQAMHMHNMAHEQAMQMHNDAMRLHDMAHHDAVHMHETMTFNFMNPMM